MNKKNIGLYIHIPFCKQKCNYCDFKSYANKEEKIDTYIKWLTYEIESVGQGNQIDYKNDLDDLAIVKTIYIGGGTPSFIDSKYILQIIETIKANYQIDEKAEITIEINPGTVNKQKLEQYKQVGINRLSIGVQSTNNEILKQLGRVHTYEEFVENYKIARELGFDNINLDFIIGLPNQTIKDIEDITKEIENLNPEHISIYSLIVEDGTTLQKEIEDGKLELPSDEMERQMYWNMKTKLEEKGYIHYEISNFAKKGYESKHNTDCWEQEEYIGLGVSAHSYTNNIRFSNIDTIEAYIKNYEENSELDNLIFHEKQNKENKMKEYMILGLRKIQGIQIGKFKNKFGENPIYIYRKELQKLVEKELIEIDADNIKLTKKGIDFANLVWEEFV